MNVSDQIEARPSLVRLVAPLMLLTAAMGCGSAESHTPGDLGESRRVITPYSGSGPIRAVCTTGMVADVVRHVGGRHVAVDQIMGEGIDPHLFKPTPDVVRRLSEADVIFYSGLHLEGRMADLFEQMAKREPTVAVTRTIPPEKLIDLGRNVHDPHVWFDVGLWSLTIDAAQQFLNEFDPPHRAEYEANAAAYRTELTALDAECRSKLATIPVSSRVLVTAHDAFHYFGKAYDIEVKAIQGVSTDTEAGVREINQLVDFISARKIKAVFVEASVSERNIQAVVEGCKQQGHDVRIGGELFSDSMGRPGTPEGTYVGMVRHNVDLIVSALK